jgi:tripartite-type tricarboxylate transporter receptor subunit TctC
MLSKFLSGAFIRSLNGWKVMLILSIKAALLLVCPPTLAQDNKRPFELIVPYSPGGSVDSAARRFAAEANRETGEQWIVTNKPGAGGLLGFAALIGSKRADRLLVLSPASPLTNAPFIASRMSFDRNQVQPVCQLFENMFAIVVAQNSPIRNIEELMSLAKQKPGALSYGNGGLGTIPHVAMAAIEQATGTTFNSIAYTTDAGIWNDLYGGSISFAAQPVATSIGKPVRILAVLGAKRHPLLPTVPSAAELGFPSIGSGLNGLFVEASVPEKVMAQLQQVCKSVGTSQAFVDATQAMGQIPAFLPSKEFGERLKAVYDKNTTLIPSLNIPRQ